MFLVSTVIYQTVKVVMCTESLHVHIFIQYVILIPVQINECSNNKGE